LGKSSCGSLPLWLHHKIEKQITGGAAWYLGAALLFHFGPLKAKP
jgi:hypothetical protein